MYAEMKRFFDTPMEGKMKIAMANKPSAHRGYFPFLEENADEKGEGDVKEGIDIGMYSDIEIASVLFVFLFILSLSHASSLEVRFFS